MAVPWLHMILAVEKRKRQQIQQAINELYRLAQKKDLFTGLSHTYHPLGDADNQDDPRSEMLPAQYQKPVFDAQSLFLKAVSEFGELFDVVATKDFANTHAAADIELEDGTIIAESVPAVFLLFLEKSLTDLDTIVSKLPTLNAGVDWQRDERGYWKGPVNETIRSRKLAKVLVRYPATDKHPAQTELVHEDLPVGKWLKVELSGAMDEVTRDMYLKRIRELYRAVKFAREKANTIPAPAIHIGYPFVRYIESGDSGAVRAA